MPAPTPPPLKVPKPPVTARATTSTVTAQGGGATAESLARRFKRAVEIAKSDPRVKQLLEGAVNFRFTCQVGVRLEDGRIVVGVGEEEPFKLVLTVYRKFKRGTLRESYTVAVDLKLGRVVSVEKTPVLTPGKTGFTGWELEKAVKVVEEKGGVKVEDLVLVVKEDGSLLTLIFKSGGKAYLALVNLDRGVLVKLEKLKS